ncbi:MAG: signal peptidase II [Planctomycetota bacterium]|jgi:signal peptidase II
MMVEEDSSIQETGAAPALLDRLFLKRKAFWILTLLILALDLVSKEIVIDFVREHGNGQPYWIQKPWFALVDVQNKGGPWGMGSDYSGVLKIIRLLALGVILYILYSTPYKYRIQALSLGLVMGGALGNIWDSWKIGFVRDFLYFDLGFPPANPWPAFNVADSAICVGVIGLALAMIYASLAQRRQGEKDTEKGVAS